MNAKRRVGDIVGWYGTAAIVIAYAMVSFKIVSANGAEYQLLNLTGAIGIIIISVIKGVRQSVVLNIFWALIAAVALLNLALR